jgi:DNA-binding transcriptional regulator YhcF (GntR family)
MRFWITKNGELPLREQLVRQVLLGIMSQELAPGHKLPSVRALARQYHIHSNTVSAAYHDLLERGWLELRRGSGLYVRPLQPADAEHGELDRMVAELLQAARRQGFQPEEVLSRLEQLVRPRTFQCILVADTEPAMRDILQAEIAAQVKIPVRPLQLADVPHHARAVVVALASRLPMLRDTLPTGIPCIPLRLRSVRGSLEAQTRPPANALVSIVSRSAEIRLWSRAMLLAVGLDPACICEVDATLDGWQDRLRLSALVVTDVVAAREMPPTCRPRVYRVIADSSIAELQRVTVTKETAESAQEIL